MSKARVRVRYRRNRQAWEVDYRDDEGQRCRPLFPTEEEALSEAAEVRKSLGQRSLLLDRPDRHITLKEYAESWLKTVASELETATLKSYRKTLELHVLPALGPLRLRDLRRRHVKALLNAKRADGHAPNGVRVMKATLSSMLTAAVDDELIDTNPALHLGATDAAPRRRDAGATVGGLLRHPRGPVSAQARPSR